MRIAKPLLLAALVILFAGTAAVGYVVLDRAAPHGDAHTQRPPSWGPDGEFEITEQQRRGITVEAVTVMRLQQTRRAEGKIAINENKSTPVFSQYSSARVVLTYADSGDVVEQGAPLVRI